MYDNASLEDMMAQMGTGGGMGIGGPGGFDPADGDIDSDDSDDEGKHPASAMKQFYRYHVAVNIYIYQFLHSIAFSSVLIELLPLYFCHLILRYS